MTSRPPLKHCPVCGVAMQASKSREDLDRWDIFGCLRCDTTILETRGGPNSPMGPQDKR